MPRLSLMYCLSFGLLIFYANPSFSQEIIEISNGANNQTFVFSCRNSISETDTVIWNFGDDCNYSPAYFPADCDFITIGKNHVEHQFSTEGNYRIKVKFKGKSFYADFKTDFKDESIYKRTTTIQGNGSFEYFTSLPFKIGQINYAVPWKSANRGTPDYFHTSSQPSQVSNWSVQIPLNFAGFSYPYDGQAYTGILTYYQSDTSVATGANTDTNSSNYREYIYQVLNDTLMHDVQYRVSFKIKLSSNSRVITPIGFYLSSTFSESTDNKVMMINPTFEITGTHDTSDWITFNHILTANGGEKYLIIGNFHTDTSTSIIDYYRENFIKSNYGGILASIGYYYIDDVTVDYATGGIIKPGGTILVEKGEEVELNAKTFVCSSGASYLWKSDVGANEIISQQYNKSISFHPTENMMIFLSGVDGCGHFINDTARIISLSTSIEKNDIFSEIKFFPNPSKGTFYLELLSATSNSIDLLIYNANGAIIKEQTIGVRPGINKFNFEIEGTNGVYSLLLSSKEKALYYQRIVIKK